MEREVEESYRLARRIVERLVSLGYTSYFAGGWVRDFLLGHPSEDIDIATSAPLEKILDLFPHTIQVGLAFGVVVIPLGGHTFELSTFRKDLLYSNGRKPEGITFSTPEQDALRRDFTINGMFYDPLHGDVIDYVGGREDLKLGVIRAIGNPHERFVEDRLRMVRAIRFMTRFNFHLELRLQEAIWENATTLFPAVAVERIWQELQKMAHYPHFDRALVEMHRLALLPEIFPVMRGEHLNEVKARAALLSYIPPGSPAVYYILPIFPRLSQSELIEIFKELKTGAKIWHQIELWCEARGLVEGMAGDLAWVDFLSQEGSTMALESYIATLPDREKWSAWSGERRERLAPHVAHVKEKSPLVSSNDLKRLGVAPGPVMGRLLRECQRYAVEENVKSREAILEWLSLSPLWREVMCKS